jgi:nucleoside-diphosphate-sugar epimerase
VAKVLITGYSGFIGGYLLSNNRFHDFVKLDLRASHPFVPNDIFSVIHLAGKAHDFSGKDNLNDYYKVNTEFTKKLFDSFLESKASVFIYISSIKSVADNNVSQLTENELPNPQTHYGKSKLLAEQHILSKSIPKGKRIYILRPAMVYGPGNKGNIELLFKFVKLSLPWPLGSYNNKRSFCHVGNLEFVINEIISDKNFSPGIYNVVDNEEVSTNELVQVLGDSIDKKVTILNIPKPIIRIIARIGDLFNLPFNTDRLIKLTDNFSVSNAKLLKELNKDLPFSLREGIESFIGFTN